MRLCDVSAYLFRVKRASRSFAEFPLAVADGIFHLENRGPDLASVNRPLQLVRSIGRAAVSSADRRRDTLRLTTNYLAFLQLASIGLLLRFNEAAPN